MISAVRNTFFDTPAAMNTTAPGATEEPPKGDLAPSTPRSLPTNPSGMGRDEFLKMLVAQLKNQDPLNPMDGKDMAAQLAQFSSVEQLIKMNESMDAQKGAQAQVVTALDALTKTQNERADELASLVEGQMAMSTVGKTGVTPGDNVYVDASGRGSVLVDTGTRSGNGRLSFTAADGTVRTVDVSPIGKGQQAFDVQQLQLEPPLASGKYTIKCEVATDGGQYQSVKTYTTGRITGMRYEQGNPILIIGDDLSLPMSKLTQIRG
ncbi:MAG: flagellar hook capping FlgD N-terminal domain-containing protein [Gemmatimonadota bacterium]